MIKLSTFIMKNCLLGSILVSKWNPEHQNNKYVVLTEWKSEYRMWRVELADIDIISKRESGKLHYWEEMPYRSDIPRTIMYIDEFGTCKDDGRKYQIWNGKPIRCRKMLR